MEDVPARPPVTSGWGASTSAPRRFKTMNAQLFLFGCFVVEVLMFVALVTSCTPY